MKISRIAAYSIGAFALFLIMFAMFADLPDDRVFVDRNDIDDYAYVRIDASDLYERPISEGNYRITNVHLAIDTATQTTHNITYVALFPNSTDDPTMIDGEIDPQATWRDLGATHGKYIFLVLPMPMADEFGERVPSMNRDDLRQYFLSIEESAYGHLRLLNPDAFVRTSAIRTYGLDPSLDFYELSYTQWSDQNGN